MRSGTFTAVAHCRPLLLVQNGLWVVLLLRVRLPTQMTAAARRNVIIMICCIFEQIPSLLLAIPAGSVLPAVTSG